MLSLGCCLQVPQRDLTFHRASHKTGSCVEASHFIEALLCWAFFGVHDWRGVVLGFICVLSAGAAA